MLRQSGHFHIFVGDLSPEVTDSTLFACFSVYPSCSWVPWIFICQCSLWYIYTIFILPVFRYVTPWAICYNLTIQDLTICICKCIKYLIVLIRRDARVMWDNKTGRSRGFGFVSFRNQQVFCWCFCFVFFQANKTFLKKSYWGLFNCNVIRHGFIMHAVWERILYR